MQDGRVLPPPDPLPDEGAVLPVHGDQGEVVSQPVVGAPTGVLEEAANQLFRKKEK